MRIECTCWKFETPSQMDINFNLFLFRYYYYYYCCCYWLAVLLACVCMLFLALFRSQWANEQKNTTHYGNRLPINCSVLLLFNLFFLTIPRFFFASMLYWTYSSEAPLVQMNFASLIFTSFGHWIDELTRGAEEPRETEHTNTTTTTTHWKHQKLQFITKLRSFTAVDR